MPTVADEEGWPDYNGWAAATSDAWNGFGLGLDPVALNATAGGLLVMVVASLTVQAAGAPSPPSAVTDNQGNTWVKFGQLAGTNVHLSVWTTTAGATGALSTVTATPGANTDKELVYIWAVGGATEVLAATFASGLDAETPGTNEALYLFFAAARQVDTSNWLNEVGQNLIIETKAIPTYRAVSACAASGATNSRTFTATDVLTEVLNVAISFGSPSGPSSAISLRLLKADAPDLPYQLHTRML